MQVGGQVLQQEEQGIMNALLCNQVIVIKNEDHLHILTNQFIDEGHQDCGEQRLLRRVEQNQCLLSNICLAGTQSSNDRDPEACWIIVQCIQREPGDDLGSSFPRGPRGKQCCFPTASSGGEEQ